MTSPVVLEKHGEIGVILVQNPPVNALSQAVRAGLRDRLAEANADEIQLVLSCIASTNSLTRSIQQFAKVGTTSMLLTKIDEATGLGNLLPLFRNSELPISYLTNGQNVPHDIEPANASRLTRIILGMESARTV